MTDMEASMPELPPAPGTGASGAPFLERVSTSAAAAAAAAPGPAGATRPIALRRSSSFGARPGSGAGSFNGRGSISRASLLGGPGSRYGSFQDLSNRGVREPLVSSEE